jgi:hypothetical protein
MTEEKIKTLIPEITSKIKEVSSLTLMAGIEDPEISSLLNNSMQSELSILKDKEIFDILKEVPENFDSKECVHKVWEIVFPKVCGSEPVKSKLRTYVDNYNESNIENTAITKNVSKDIGFCTLINLTHVILNVQEKRFKAYVDGELILDYAKEFNQVFKKWINYLEDISTVIIFEKKEFNRMIFLMNIISIELGNSDDKSYELYLDLICTINDRYFPNQSLPDLVLQFGKQLYDVEIHATPRAKK